MTKGNEMPGDDLVRAAVQQGADSRMLPAADCLCC